MLTFTNRKWTDSEKEYIRKMQDVTDDLKKIKTMYTATDVSNGNVLCESNNAYDVLSSVQGYAIRILGTRDYTLNTFFSANHRTETYSYENASVTVDIEERVYREN